MTLLLAGLALGWAIVATFAWYRGDLERRALQNRLLGAWQAGALIPSDPMEPTPPAEPEPPGPEDGLPTDLLAWLERFDEPEARTRWAHRARAVLAKHKGKVVPTISELDAPTW